MLLGVRDSVDLLERGLDLHHGMWTSLFQRHASQSPFFPWSDRFLMTSAFDEERPLDRHHEQLDDDDDDETPVS